MATRKSKAAPEQVNTEDIAALLDKIDALISTSTNKEEIESQTVSASQMRSETFKAEGFAEAQSAEIEKGMKAGISYERYAKPCYNWMQMCEIRLGLMDHLDTEKYESPLFSYRQMREIRLGLLDRLDVSSYADLMLSATDMRNIRKTLFSKAFHQGARTFGHVTVDEETNITIRTSDDCLKAFLTIPDSLQEELSELLLMQVLQSNEIVQGIDLEILCDMVNNRRFGEEICVAEGKPPTVGKPGRYELFFENCIEKGRTAPPDGDIDYTDVNIVEMAEPGVALAQYHPSQKDVNGITVTGIVVEGTPGEELPPLTGVGFRYDKEQNLYIATESGYASYSDTTSCLNVWQIYRFNGDLAYFQSLEYDGTVHVHGSVKSSSVIRAKGDIIIDGFLENASVYSAQNVVIKGGANGGSHGIIEAGGSVRGNFFENMKIKANGLIEGNYFLNCNITTDDRLVARGKKARILGGDVVAAIGVKAVVIGNYMSKKTRFNVGDTYEIEKRITNLEHERATAMEEFDQLAMGKQKLILLMGESQAEKNALFQKTCQAMQAKESRAEQLELEINRLKIVRRRAENAFIHVQKELQAGVVFTIGGFRKIAEQTVSRSLYLTKESAQKKASQKS